MGFTNVAWESRSTEQLASNLTGGPGPSSMGQAGVGWVRVANEMADVSQVFAECVAILKANFVSDGAEAAAAKLDQLGSWLQAMSLSAAGNGQRAELTAAAFGAAVMAMPTVAEAVEAQTSQEVMASLAAYNGTVLNGRFAELEDAVNGHHETASAVMYQYEDTCSDLAQPWEQPAPPDVAKGDALATEQSKSATDDGERAAGHAGGVGTGGAARVPLPLAPFAARELKTGTESLQGRSIATTAPGAGGGAMTGAGGYSPLAALGRGSADREHDSSLEAVKLDGGGEPGAGLSAGGQPWLPATQQNDAPFAVTNVSWGPSTAVFDEFAVPEEPDVPRFAEVPQPTLDQVSNRWVSPAVIGDQGRLDA